MIVDPDARIDPYAPLPPFRQLVEILTARIERGDWPPERPITAEARLAEEYGIARNTVRRAIAVLTERGLLFVVPKRGTFVAKR
ncbi:winged helix-turn-helix transcriptional regulator [Streptomyces sp. K1PN6]|uniref:Winged helix-turn-helix transcriptional regulator n=1 Tax=Streptomyces acidicola TaxID=2596892 RepID=A0A5N8X7P2_9ACTN|nr:winged helix-turn-helix transcriptional regulator [Streptomyces acidicola]